MPPSATSVGVVSDEPPPVVAETTADNDVPRPDPDLALKTLGLFNDWIKQADVKCGAALAASGVATGVLFNLVKGQDHPPAWLALTALFCGIALLATGIFAVLGLRPRLGLHLRPLRWRRRAALHESQPGSLLFFVHIHRDYPHGAPRYSDALRDLTQDRDAFTRAVGEQAHANAGVASRKHLWAGRAIAALALALLLLALLAAMLTIDTNKVNWSQWLPDAGPSPTASTSTPAPTRASTP